MKHFLKSLFKDIIDQSFTILGMAIAWMVLEGSAKDIVGILTWMTIGIWVLTFPLRYEKDDE
jgi:hypothetical protein